MALFKKISKADALTKSKVFSNMMRSHFMERSDPDLVYSMRRQVLEMNPVTEMLYQPATKRCEKQAEDDMDIGCNMDIDTETSKLVYFKVVPLNIAKSKTLPVAVGAGGHIANDTIPVTLHSCTDPSPGVGHKLVASVPSATMNQPEPVLMLSFGAQHVETICEEMVQWSSCSTRWMPKDINPEDFGGSSDALVSVSELVTRMIGKGSVHVGDSRCFRATVGYVAEQGEEALLAALERLGVVTMHTRNAIDEWCLTTAAARSMSSAVVCKKPVKAFECPANLALEACTTFQLAVRLEEEEWTWRAWVPPSQRTKRMMLKDPIPDSYVPGGQRIWMSTAEGPGKQYCRCLLTSKDRVSNGKTGQDQIAVSELMPKH